ncbi:MAG: YihY/virulence factor BrkB family protein [Tannerella sp.]|jgi:membrane protein|nr:YihY/virulence factor BrkB family protein [Tannerella sp.]
MADKKDRKKEKNISARISNLLAGMIRFITYDIWRITENEMSGLKKAYIFLVKTIILAVRGFRREDLLTRASALTYSTLLAIVPMLAVIVGVASGFGMRETVRESLYSYFPGHQAELGQAFGFADNYLSMAQGGLFIGIGLILLLYTVISLISAIESSFNDIWQVKKGRPWNRRITDYLAFLIILPAMLTLSGGLSLFSSTLRNSFLNEYLFLTPVADFFLNTVPYVITILFFTVLYVLVPNTRVRFPNALAAGFIVGCAFQLFQVIYIAGQIWVSRYNAIYGSFAALPLLFLWLQVSWILCLFGAEIAYASQNVGKFGFERDSRNVSRRYKDFLLMLVATLIVKRFEEGGTPFTADEISGANRIPIRLTTEILYLLTELGVITEICPGGDTRDVHYQPALDINRISVGFLLRRIDGYGSENFKIDISGRFAGEWQTLLKTREDMYAPNENVLLKDLPDGR